MVDKNQPTVDIDRDSNITTTSERSNEGHPVANSGNAYDQIKQDTPEELEEEDNIDIDLNKK